jgi:DNA-binding beta-propeller fold protein YncE
MQYFSRDGGFRGKWGEYGEEWGQFKAPTGVGIGRDDCVFVADTDNNRLQVFTPVGVYCGNRGGVEPSSENGYFDAPVDVVIAPSGRVFVADCYNHRIQYFNSDLSAFLGQWGTRGTRDRQFEYPRSVVVAADGYVYVSESYRVQFFTQGGAFRGKWGAKGFGDGEFNRARGIAAAPDGTIYVVDSANHRVQYFK